MKHSNKRSRGLMAHQDQSLPHSSSTSNNRLGGAKSPHHKLVSRIRNLAGNFGHISGTMHSNRGRLSPNTRTHDRDFKAHSSDMKPIHTPETYQQQIRERDEIISDLRRQLIKKDQEIACLVSELYKYQSVFKLKPPGHGIGRPRGMKTEIGSMGTEVDEPRKRGIGISAEPRALRMDESEQPKHYPKTSRTREILNQAILENDFMRNLDTSQVVEIVECMYSVNFASGSTIIREGELGSVVYVMEEGSIEVTRAGIPLRVITHPTVFGELAILYNCMRTATVKALTPCSLWAVDRKSFQAIMMKTGILKHQRHLEFLKSVPTFASLAPETLAKIVDLLEEVHYEPGEYVIRQGARGDTFYIIASGQVQVTQNTRPSSGTTVPQGEEKETFVRLMGRGEWFGEKALKNEDVRTANIIATYPNGVDCLVLDRESYGLLAGNLGTFERRYPDEDILNYQAERLQALELKETSLQDFDVIGTLGVGGFGRVELVQMRKDLSRTYALKKLKKHYIVITQQQEHVMNERVIQMSCNSDFIVRLYKTFKDRKFLYLLMEVCLGGELWTILRNRICFSEAATQFYVACVVEALTYLHSRGIVYRDLKPENLLLDQYGYCKMADFGFAKKIGFGRKTWTFCGTPEYVAPEIILNKGHDFSADSWSLGILIYELMNGTPPFTSEEPIKTYTIILRGINAIEFPRKISRNAQILIKKLCRENPTERFGYSKEGLWEIRKHVWFEGFDWEGLQQRQLKPPYVPQISSSTDDRNFDHYAPDPEEPPDDVSGWDKDF